MPKVKVPRKSTSVDMTAMTDVAFLLLTFFMLATKFKPDEPVQVDTPSSVSELKLEETNVLLITVDKTGKAFCGIDGQPSRVQLLEMMGSKYKQTFTDEEKKSFSLINTVGVPMAQLKQFLDMPAEERNKVQQEGIPKDSTNNELADWIQFGRTVLYQNSNKEPQTAVKADAITPYPVIKDVISTLQERKINSFRLITTMEKPE